jgi:hypothetical protein
LHSGHPNHGTRSATSFIYSSFIAHPLPTMAVIWWEPKIGSIYSTNKIDEWSQARVGTYSQQDLRRPCCWLPLEEVSSLSGVAYKRQSTQAPLGSHSNSILLCGRLLKGRWSQCHLWILLSTGGTYHQICSTHLFFAWKRLSLKLY